MIRRDISADEADSQRPGWKDLFGPADEVKTVKELVDTSYYFFQDEVVYDPEAVDKILRKLRARSLGYPR